MDQFLAKQSTDITYCENHQTDWYYKTFSQILLEVSKTDFFLGEVILTQRDSDHIQVSTGLPK